MAGTYPFDAVPVGDLGDAQLARLAGAMVLHAMQVCGACRDAWRSGRSPSPSSTACPFWRWSLTKLAESKLAESLVVEGGGRRQQSEDLRELLGSPDLYR